MNRWIINTPNSSVGTFYICWENASRSESAGIGIVVVANGRDVFEDMEVEKSGEVVMEEESMVTTCTVGGQEARWTKISTAGGGAVVVEAAGGDFSCSASISSPS